MQKSIKHVSGSEEGGHVTLGLVSTAMVGIAFKHQRTTVRSARRSAFRNLGSGWGGIVMLWWVVGGVVAFIVVVAIIAPPPPGRRPLARDLQRREDDR